MNNGKINIKVIGIGGGGGNATNHIAKLNGNLAEFVAVNTDVMALNTLEVNSKVQIGTQLTKGFGSGADPAIGEKAALEDIEKINEIVADTDVIFLAAGLGGGTGTGAIPIIAEAAKKAGAVVIAIVTLPFKFEGEKRAKIAAAGLSRLREIVDSIICIPNERIFKIIDENVSIDNAFRLTDRILNDAFSAITGLIGEVGIINIDYNDVKTVISEKGDSVVCFGEASGENSPVKAVRYAMASPLLERSDIVGAKQVLISFVSGKSVAMKDFQEATRIISTEIKREANIVFGVILKPEFGSKTEVTIIATGLPDISEIKATPFDSNRTFEQSTIDFFQSEKGLFTNIEPTMIDAVNFDTPTYIRWGRKKLMSTVA